MPATDPSRAPDPTDGWADRDTPRLAQTVPLTIILDRLRSAFNVGNVFRVAEAVRAEQILTCGYTATPPHAKLATTARGCDRMVPCSHFAEVSLALDAAKKRGCRVYAVETDPSADYFWRVQYDFPAAFVFGNEALGLGGAALRGCDAVVRLPALGRKHSINVGNCAAVILYEALRQWVRQHPEVERALDG